MAKLERDHPPARLAGSELAGKCSATVMSLVQSARLCGDDPCVYLKDVLTRLPTQSERDIDELLPHRGSFRRADVCNGSGMPHRPEPRAAAMRQTAAVG